MLFPAERLAFIVLFAILVFQGANLTRMLLIVSRSSPSSWTLSLLSNAVCFWLRALFAEDL